ncbi:kinase-like protein [Lojkania enalia]|uniref:Kinase-like protein n=1 Tax=Lojkania enalia TaxID=147567 RepID=A0A9P4KJQ3_9PLEO|nr:kinase-like protein [Didymosphaeria enalia]
MPSSPPQWLWDEARGEFYFWSEAQKRYIYQSGHTVSSIDAPVKRDTNRENFHAQGSVSGSAQGSISNSQNQGTPSNHKEIHLYQSAYGYMNHVQSNGISLALKDIGSSMADMHMHHTSSNIVSQYGPGEYETLDPRFRVQYPGREFFRVGKVFKVMWAEPMGTNPDGSSVSWHRLRGNVFVRMRCFVVVREGPQYCACVPILTYKYRGVTKKELRPDRHAIAYTGSMPPKMLQDEILTIGEGSMREPIKIQTRTDLEEMSPESRINYGKIYTVEHNVKVYDFGDVDADFIGKFREHFDEIWKIQSPVVKGAIHHDYYVEQEDPYRSVSLLGKGSYGFVDQVEARLQNNTVYARKLFRLPNQVSKRENFVQAIKREAQITYRLRHHHIVTVYETYEWRQHFGIIMRPVAQGDLATLLDQVDNTSGELRDNFLQYIPKWCGCLIQAIAYIHGELVRHKDIKPANILINNHDILLTDFGLAEDMAQKDSTGTEGSVGVHTVRYCAPEVKKDNARRGRSADIFSLGCVFLEMATVLIGGVGARARLIDYGVNDNALSRAYSERPLPILHWILYLWIKAREISNLELCSIKPKPSHPEPSSDMRQVIPVSTERHASPTFTGSLIADLSFFMMDPDQSQRATAQQLLAMMQNPQLKYKSGIHAQVCVTCRTHSSQQRSTVTTPVLNSKDKIISNYNFPDSHEILGTYVLMGWTEAKKAWT